MVSPKFYICQDCYERFYKDPEDEFSNKKYLDFRSCNLCGCSPATEHKEIKIRNKHQNTCKDYEMD